jgi:hypothetical protein
MPHLSLHHRRRGQNRLLYFHSSAPLYMMLII